MKSFRQELCFELPSRTGFVNITNQVAGCVKESGITEGLCLVNSMHVTSSVFVDADESGLQQDREQWLEGLAPQQPLMLYLHNKTGDDNGDAHLKRQILGREVVVAVTNEQLDLGRWEQVFYGELDGGREKRVLVKVIGD